MSQTVQFFKVATVPVGPFVANAVYLVGGATDDQFSIYVANAAGTNVKHIPSRAEVDTLIANAVGGYQSGYIVADIAARNALNPTVYTQCLVIDASADDTVDAGAATYVYSVAQTQWIKISEAESMDVVINWANIVGTPNSSAAAIDSAVSWVSTQGSGVLAETGWVNSNKSFLETVMNWFATENGGINTAATWVSVNGSDVLTNISTLQGGLSTLEGRVGTAEGGIGALEGRQTITEGEVTTLQGTVATWTPKVAGWDVASAYVATNETSLNAAIAATHTHANADQLAKVGEDAQGNITYNGAPVFAALSEVSW